MIQQGSQHMSSLPPRALLFRLTLAGRLQVPFVAGTTSGFMNPLGVAIITMHTWAIFLLKLVRSFPEENE